MWDVGHGHLLLRSKWSELDRPVRSCLPIRSVAEVPWGVSFRLVASTPYVNVRVPTRDTLEDKRTTSLSFAETAANSAL